MKFIDLEYENREASMASQKDFFSIESSGKYLLSDFLSKFEECFAQEQSVNYCLGVKNATDALYMCFNLLGASSRTIIVPQFGAYPTIVAAVQSCAKKIIAAPVDSSLTLNLREIDVPRNSIIVPVHLFGNETDMAHIGSVAKDTDSIIIEDCAQSTGIQKSPYSLAAVHSFYPTKPMGCRGDGGAILSDDEDFYATCKKSRFYGLNSDGAIDTWGFNSRLDEWQAAFLMHKMSYYRQNNQTRQKNAKSYMSIQHPGIQYTDSCVYHQYVALYNNRDVVRTRMESLGIPTMIHYPRMLSDMPHLKNLQSIHFVDKSKKRFSDHVLSLPVGPHLTIAETEAICSVIYGEKNESISFEEIA